MYVIFIFLIYNLMQFVMFPLFFGYLLWRKFIGKEIVGNIWQRFGFVPRSVADKTVIWLHAVSVGEVLSIQQLIIDIKKNDPDVNCYVSVGTSTGLQIAKKNLSADFITFIPYDFLPCMLLAFFRIAPSKMIIVESEIWPNLLILSTWFKIRKILINARISSRSYKRYRVLKFIFTPLFNSFEGIYVQTDLDLAKFSMVGVDLCRLSVLGDIKAYNVVSKRFVVSTVDSKLPYKILLVGSIHPGELDYYLRLLVDLKNKNSDLRLILAPRHFSWIDELEIKLKNAGLRYLLWEQSSLGREDQNLSQALEDKLKMVEVICVCKLGELFNLYQFANIFYLGGTFVDVGGHNLLEAAAWAKPCVIGPHYQNTKNNADKMEQVGGLIKVEDYETLKSVTQKLLFDDQLRTRMGDANYEWVGDVADRVRKVISTLIC